jgi:hypothetical protein
MALQVWLPLNGNLKNLGTSGNIQFGGTPATSVGKVTSNSLQNTSNTTGGYISNAEINLGYHQSMFCWVYFNSFYATASLTGILGQHRYLSNQGMGLTAKYVSSTSGYLSINTGNGTSRTFNTYCGNTLLTSGKWYHVGYTYDGTTVTLYVNGNVDGTFTITDMKIVSDYIVLFAWSLGGTSGATIYGDYKLNGRLNDVRLYNHCLSLKEVKNLSRGLMLHYTLSRSGANLLVNSSNYLSVTQTKSAKDGYQSYPIYANSLTAGQYIYSIEVTKGTLASSHNTSGVDYTKNYWTLWTYVDTSTYSDSSYAHFAIANCFTSSNLLGRIGNTYYWSISISSTYPNLAVRVNVYSDGTNNASITFGKIKLEQGSKFTPWIPNSADTLYNQMGFNTNVENDTSGYGNNGTRVNITNWNTDAPKYLSSMIFNGSNGYIYLPKGSGRPKDAITVSVWGYMSDWSTYNARLLSCTEGGGWNFEPSSNKIAFSIGTGSSSNIYKTVLSATTLSQLGNKWHHFVGTYDGLLVKIYIDGVLENTTTAYSTTTPIFYANNYTFVGAEAGGNTTTPAGNYFNGKLSDVRIYSTTLSADDILELYQTSASMDKSNNIHCYELVEI